MGSFPSREELDEVTEWATKNDMHTSPGAFVFFILGFTGVFLNVSELYVIWKSQVLKKAASMRLVAGLSLSDMAFSFFIFFNYFYQLVSGSPIGNMPGFSTYCQVSGYYIAACLMTSVNIFVLCAYERYKKIITPFDTLRAKNIPKLYAICWVIGSSTPAINFAVGGYTLQSSGLFCNIDFRQPGSVVIGLAFIGGPMLYVAWAYYKIVTTIKSMGKDVAGDKGCAKENAIAMKMLSLCICFLVCWTPAIFMLVFQCFRIPGFDDPAMDITAGVFATFNSVASPVLDLYLFSNLKDEYVKQIPVMKPVFAMFGCCAKCVPKIEPHSPKTTTKTLTSNEPDKVATPAGK
uniref:G-protein coupled receptors family 1 profile domain-containing protein n=1 Tax=Florenciella parvula TaxID=236787 RepID=A0A7S2BMH6_9STRA|mmetsp:Transcript_18257/g.38292  ORF Transcript_18257/g.38292 Transcript_18257/m.38292 type:complete len:348 (+) Transcript_18257:35-1078(+)